MASAWRTTPFSALIARPAGHEEVAGVAVGDVDDVALLAELLDVVAEHDLHSTVSVSRRPRRPRRPPLSALGRRRRTATAAVRRLRSSPVSSAPSAAPRRRRALERQLHRSPQLAAIAAVTAVATVATSALAALGHLTDAVGQERHLAGDTDRLRHRDLLLLRVAGDAPGADLRPLRHEPPQQVDVLVVDPVDPLAGEDRRLLLGHAPPVGGCALALASFAVLCQSTSSPRSGEELEGFFAEVVVSAARPATPAAAGARRRPAPARRRPDPCARCG